VTMHWDGSSWQLIRPPDLVGAFLTAVAGANADDVFAVGTYDSAPAHTLILHWDGTAWSVMDSPDPGTTWQSLSAVAAVSAQEAWAVGSYYVGLHLYPFVLNWDGTSWTVDPSPVPNPENFNHLYGVSADSPSDIWAVGDFVDPDRGWYSTLVEHRCDGGGNER
jgi:hypothetical protein